MPCAQAVGGEFLARQVYQPDVAAQPALAAELEEDRGGQHQRGGGRVVVVGPGRGQPGAAAAAVLFVAVFHVGRVVMIGHDDRPAAVAAGNHDHQVALLGLPCRFSSQPPEPGKTEIGLPAERQVADGNAIGHAGLLDELAVIGQQVVAQGVQVAW